MRGRKGEAEEVGGKRKRRQQVHHGEKQKGAEPGSQQARRREMAGLEGRGMQACDVGFPATVTTILCEEIFNGLAALPADLQLRVEEQLVSLPPDAIVELEVLVGQQALVPATELAGEHGRIGTERNVVDRPDAAAMMISGIADAEGGGHRGGDRAAGRRDALPIFAATDPTPVAGLEVMNQPADVIGRHAGVRIDADEPRAARRAQGEVERARDGALGIAEELDALVAAREAPDDGTRAVGRRAIDDQQLEIAPVLVEDRGQAGPEVGFLVTGRYDDRHEVRHHRQRMISPIVRSTMTRSSQGDQCSM